MKVYDLQNAIDNPKEMLKVFETVWAYCFQSLQYDCEGCPVADMETEICLEEE